MAVTVRDATVDDAHAIAEVHVASWRWAYRGQVPEAILDALSVEDREAMWRRSLSEGKARAARNGNLRQQGPHSAREIRRSLAELTGLVSDMAAGLRLVAELLAEQR